MRNWAFAVCYNKRNHSQQWDHSLPTVDCSRTEPIAGVQDLFVPVPEVERRKGTQGAHSVDFLLRSRGNIFFQVKPASGFTHCETSRGDGRRLECDFVSLAKSGHADSSRRNEMKAEATRRRKRKERLAGNARVWTIPNEVIPTSRKRQKTDR